MGRWGAGAMRSAEGVPNADLVTRAPKIQLLQIHNMTFCTSRKAPLWGRMHLGGVSGFSSVPFRGLAFSWVNYSDLRTPNGG